jgi:hypothetical protein
MPRINSLSKITVYAPQRGKLGLRFEAIDGTTFDKPATPATIRQVMRQHGQELSAEQLASIAFCGFNWVLSLIKNDIPISITRPAKQETAFQMARETQRIWFDLSSAWLEAYGRVMPALRTDARWNA